MQAEYTSHQQRIIQIATERFAEACPDGSVMPHFKGEKKSVRVALLYRAAGHTFMARELVRWYATRETVQAKCDRLMGLLSKTYEGTLDTRDTTPRDLRGA